MAARVAGNRPPVLVFRFEVASRPSDWRAAFRQSTSAFDPAPRVVGTREIPVCSRLRLTNRAAARATLLFFPALAGQGWNPVRAGPSHTIVRWEIAVNRKYGGFLPAPLHQGRRQAGAEAPAGTTLSKVYNGRMADSIAELRKKASHCRELADITRDGPVRTELTKMAAEFDRDADKLEQKERRAIQR